jgi:hypothetical protein
MDDTSPTGIDDTIARSLEHVDAAIATVERVIRSNRRLAQRPGHAESAQQRISEGEHELGALRAERLALGQGDLATALEIAEEFRRRRS